MKQFFTVLLVEILQLVHGISSFSEVLYIRVVLKNFWKFTAKRKKQSSGVVLSKDVLKDFAKFTEKHLCRNLFFNKVAGWKPETLRSSHWKWPVKYKALAQVLSCKFCEIFKNTFSYITAPVAASVRCS